MFIFGAAILGLVAAGTAVGLWGAKKYADRLVEQAEAVSAEQIETLQRQQLAISLASGIAVTWAASSVMKQKAGVALALGAGTFAIQQFVIGKKKVEVVTTPLEGIPAPYGALPYRP